ncbi:GNAT family N-acetyltransferase [Nitriliruptoraceae bacterium ZYF776]|nr:GNAT family N-acetyltransferase [Profundirhabdus halotolerans]
MTASLAALGLELVPAHEVPADDLLRFELAERAWFRRSIPDRGDDYYTREAVEASLASARTWWEAGTDRLHVLRDEAGEVVARANLVDIEAGTASLGYRVAERRTGRGVATAAVAVLLERAPGYGVDRVCATTSTDNVASQRVLRRLGFVELDTPVAPLEFDGRTLPAVRFERRVGDEV